MSNLGLRPQAILPDRVRESRKKDHDFRARIYKALVLHSMAIAASRLGWSATSPYASYMECILFISNAFELWHKTNVTIGGTKNVLSLTHRHEGLETYDFLYVFLLKKLIPHNQLSSWTAEATFPPEDRAMTCGSRGMFDTDVDSGIDWHSYHGRYAMVQTCTLSGCSRVSTPKNHAGGTTRY